MDDFLNKTELMDYNLVELVEFAGKSRLAQKVSKVSFFVYFITTYFKLAQWIHCKVQPNFGNSKSKTEFGSCQDWCFWFPQQIEPKQR
jgi:hypothetical protein